MSGPDEAWVAAVSTWANAQRDIEALVQIGSRVQSDTPSDEWSDYDYQVITTNPGKYRSGEFTREIGRRWAWGKERAFGNVVKITAVYEGALEADFIVLNYHQVRLATAALRWPATSGMWPRALVSGINSLRGVAGSGWKVLKGGRAWERRYARITPATFGMTERQFKALSGEFWVQLVWAAKKALRGELVASQRTLHLYLVEDSLRMHEEQVLLEGSRAYPRGRRAEAWLSATQLASVSTGARPEKTQLLEALAQISEGFEGAEAAVSKLKGWRVEDHQEIRKWISQLR
jgi:Streptomycin adenylyltransferase